MSTAEQQRERMRAFRRQIPSSTPEQRERWTEEGFSVGRAAIEQCTVLHSCALEFARQRRELEQELRDLREELARRPPAFGEGYRMPHLDIWPGQESIWENCR